MSDTRPLLVFPRGPGHPPRAGLSQRSLPLLEGDREHHEQESRRWFEESKPYDVRGAVERRTSPEYLLAAYHGAMARGEEHEAHAFLGRACAAAPRGGEIGALVERHGSAAPPPQADPESGRGHAAFAEYGRRVLGSFSGGVRKGPPTDEGGPSPAPTGVRYIARDRLGHFPMTPYPTYEGRKVLQNLTRPGGDRPSFTYGAAYRERRGDEPEYGAGPPRRAAGTDAAKGPPPEGPQPDRPAGRTVYHAPSPHWGRVRAPPPPPVVVKKGLSSLLDLVKGDDWTHESPPPLRGDAVHHAAAGEWHASNRRGRGRTLRDYHRLAAEALRSGSDSDTNEALTELGGSLRVLDWPTHPDAPKPPHDPQYHDYDSFDPEVEREVNDWHRASAKFWGGRSEPHATSMANAHHFAAEGHDPRRNVGRALVTMADDRRQLSLGQTEAEEWLGR